MSVEQGMCKGFLFATLAATVALSSTLFGQEPKAEEAFSLRYWAEARTFSVVPNQELATYRSYTSGGVSPNGTLGLGVGDKKREFNVSVVSKLKSRRFLTTVTVKPSKEDTDTRAQVIDCDLSDLKPQSLEIARDRDGRVYWLSLIPRLIEEPKSRQFKVSDLRFEHWRFPSSPVILNDQDYIGRLSMSSGPVAWCDIPGIAKVEFSLLHLKDAAAIGTLQDGVVNIAHESGTTLRISDIKNGNHDQVLTNGPYIVWVRWNKPSQSLEEHRKALKLQLASLKERVKNGDLSPPPGTLERLEKMSDSDRIAMFGNGVRGVEEGELVKPTE